MAEAHDIKSMKAGSTGGHRWGGFQSKAEHVHSKDSGEVLQKALATVLRAFPTLFQDLCDDCQQLLESRLASLGAGGATRSSAHEASSFPISPNVSYGDSWGISDLATEPPTLSVRASYSKHSSENKKEWYARSGKEAFDHKSSSYGESFSVSDYANGRSSRKGSEETSLSISHKQVHYHENGKEQNEEPSYEGMSAVRPQVITNNYHSQNIPETLASYKNALTKAGSSTASVTTGPPRHYSKDSNSSVIVQKPHSNRYVSTSSSSDAASLTNLKEENGLQNMKQEDEVEQSEQMCFQKLNCKKDYKCLERVNGRLIDTAEGLELHTGVFNASEQAQLVAFVLELQKLGRSNKLLGRTYSEPRKWMPGKGRVTIQFGCCYNYAVDKQGNLPGIVRDETVEPLPKLIKATIKRMVQWHVLPPSCVPDSCIINIYDEGDCIPPHIDHHDFVRPFCTLSLLSECNIVFGSNLKIIAPGEFKGLLTIPLPTGSVLVLKGNGADVAKHAVPAVPTKRISITFRKMDSQKIPRGFTPEKDLQGIVPI